MTQPEHFKRVAIENCRTCNHSLGHVEATSCYLHKFYVGEDGAEYRCDDWEVAD